MQKVIKSYLEYGERCGIAKQVEGKVVDAEPHPKFKCLWQFKFGGETWVASNYAFKE